MNRKHAKECSRIKNDDIHTNETGIDYLLSNDSTEAQCFSTKNCIACPCIQHENNPLKPLQIHYLGKLATLWKAKNAKRRQNVQKYRVPKVFRLGTWGFRDLRIGGPLFRRQSLGVAGFELKFSRFSSITLPGPQIITYLFGVTDYDLFI